LFLLQYNDKRIVKNRADIVCIIELGNIGNIGNLLALRKSDTFDIKPRVETSYIVKRDIIYREINNRFISNQRTTAFIQTNVLNKIKNDMLTSDI